MLRRGRLAAGGAAVVLLLGACTPADEPADDPSGAPDDPAGDLPGEEPEVAPGVAAPGGDLVELVREFAPQTVAVEISAQQLGQVVQGAGSGVIWRSDGIIITNNHVVEPAEEIVVVLADGTRYDAELIAADVRTDLALLQIDAEGLPAAEFADELPELGELAVAIGNPLGFQNTVTSGIISGVERSLPLVPGQPPLVGLIQTDAAISSGNSGGALVRADGTAIGINVAVIEGSEVDLVAQGLGFAIPSTTVTAVAEQLLEEGEVRHAYLGIAGVSVTPQLAEQFDLGQERGALIGEVEPNGPADQAGLQQGDVIVGLDDQEIDDLGQLLAALQARDPGQQVTVEVVRGGDTSTTEVTLAELPEDEAPDEPVP
jgi:S1-C subfamily serine protease